MKVHGVVKLHLEHRATSLIHQKQQPLLIAEVQCSPLHASTAKRPRVDLVSLYDVIDVTLDAVDVGSVVDVMFQPNNVGSGGTRVNCNGCINICYLYA